MDKIKLPWPEWKEIRKIGKGGYGTVYEIAYTDKFGVEERAAVKVIRFPQDDSENDSLLAEGYDKDSITAYHRERLDKVINEYAMMMQMKGHRNIVRCDACEAVHHEDGMGWDVFIRMELLTSLHTKLKEGKLSETEIIKLGKDLCQALMLCEEKNIVHRDIKPENVFVNEYGDYKLGDFGISRTMERTTNATRTGSPRFMAPEIYKDQKYGSTVDIYSLGLVMYWLLNHYRMPFLPVDRPPTLSENEEALQKRMTGEEALPAPTYGNEELKQVVMKACAYEPGERYTTAKEFCDALTMIDAKEEIKEKEITVEQIPETDETEAVVWKKEKETESDIERKDNSLESDTDVTMSVFDDTLAKEEEEKEQNLEERVTDNKTKTNHKKAWFVGAGIVAISAIVAVVIISSSPIIKYDRAKKAFSSGNYNDAYKMYVALDDYKDSKSLALESEYMYAEELFNNKDYEKAIELYKSIGEYKDASNRIKEAQYQIALELLNQEKFLQAIRCFTDLGDYSDCENKLYEAKYGYVKSHYKTNNTKTYRYLEELCSVQYQDSQSLYNELYRWKAEIIINNREDDYLSADETVNKADKIYCHFRPSGGTPNEKIMVKYSFTFPDGDTSSGKIDDEISAGESWCCYFWQDNPEYAPTGTGTVRLYNAATGELLAEQTISIIG